MEASVKLESGMAFEARANSGHVVRIDASESAGGADSAARPMELMLMSLGGCTGMDVISILRKKRQSVTGFEVTVDADQADGHPHVFTHIRVHYIVRGQGVDPKAVARAVDLSRDRYCPAQAMLTAAVTIEHSYEIIEEELEPTG